MTNKKGMTLVEVLVYIVLAGMLLAPVIMLMQNSSVSMARDASNVNLRMSGRELLNIIYDDLRNTGYKLKPNTFNFDDTTVSYVNLNDFHKYVAACTAATHPSSTIYGPCRPPRFGTRIGTGDDTISGKFDVSSFMPTNNVGGNKFYDLLTVRMGKLSPTGNWQGIDTITYYVDKDTLKRRIDGITNTAKPNPSTIKLASNVEALKFRYSEDLLDWYDTFTNNDFGRYLKGYVQYIKVIIVTKDPKKLSASKTTTITLIEPEGSNPGLIFTKNDQALYERHEIVIPIPNNGLYP